MDQTSKQSFMTFIRDAAVAYCTPYFGLGFSSAPVVSHGRGLEKKNLGTMEQPDHVP
jgi:hypothetical protein